MAAPSWQDTARDETEGGRHVVDGPTHWYGWQILLSDAASVLVMAGGASSDERAFNSLAYLGVLGYVAAPPIIHGVHGQGGRALSSLGMRLGLPVGGAIAGIIASSGCYNGEGDEFCQLGYAGTGFLLGLVGAMAIDAAIAWEPVPRERSTALRLAPLLLVSERETRLGLSGSF